MIVRRAICAVFGHRPVFTHITLPRQWVCATCGRRLR